MKFPIANFQLPKAGAKKSVSREIHRAKFHRAFTLVEIMVALAIFTLVIGAVYATFVSVMRASKVGLDAAAQAQRQRIALRTIEDSLMCIQSFQASQRYYSFNVTNGDAPGLSFTSRLPEVFPRNGKFGDYNLRRLTFALEAGSDGELTVESFLVRHHFSPQFIDRYLVPLGASIWSADPTTFLKFPTRALLYFFNNHGLLTFINRPAWRTVTGGSQRYIDALLSSVNIDVQLSAKVSKVRRGDDGVEIMTASGLSRFDTVIMATHSDQALALLSDPTPAERAVLGAIRFQANSAVLHTDVTMMPELRSAWAAWNYYLPAGTIESPTLTYWMNRLQRLESSKEICVTLNRDDEIDPASVLGSYEYHHPVYDVGTFEAQSRWSEINGPHRTWYVGAWWGYGFHEDGVRSARRVADAILEQGS